MFQPYIEYNQSVGVVQFSNLNKTFFIFTCDIFYPLRRAASLIPLILLSKKAKSRVCLVLLDQVRLILY